MKKSHFMIFVSSCFIMVIVACVNVPAPPKQIAVRMPVEVIELSESQQKPFIESIKNKLRDPYTAKFGPVFSFKQPKTKKITTCVFVNAKNAYGAYTGLTVYMMDEDSLEWRQDSDFDFVKGGFPIYSRICNNAYNGFQILYENIDNIDK